MRLFQSYVAVSLLCAAAQSSAEVFVGGGAAMFSESVESQGIEREALTLNLEYALPVSDYIMVGGAYHGYFFEDNQRIFNDVVDADFPRGPSHTAKSDEVAAAFAFFGRTRYRFSDYLSVNATAGWQHLNFKREIDNCIDCDTDRVNIGSGPYGEAGVDIGFGGSFRISAKYRYFFEGDVDSHYLFGFSWFPNITGED